MRSVDATIGIPLIAISVFAVGVAYFWWKLRDPFARKRKKVL